MSYDDVVVQPSGPAALMRVGEPINKVGSAFEPYLDKDMLGPSMKRVQYGSAASPLAQKCVQAISPTLGHPLSLPVGPYLASVLRNRVEARLS